MKPSFNQQHVDGPSRQRPTPINDWSNVTNNNDNRMSQSFADNIGHPTNSTLPVANFVQRYNQTPVLDADPTAAREFVLQRAAGSSSCLLDGWTGTGNSWSANTFDGTSVARDQRSIFCDASGRYGNRSHGNATTSGNVYSGGRQWPIDTGYYHDNSDATWRAKIKLAASESTSSAVDRLRSRPQFLDWLHQQQQQQQQQQRVESKSVDNRYLQDSYVEMVRRLTGGDSADVQRPTQNDQRVASNSLSSASFDFMSSQPRGGRGYSGLADVNMDTSGLGVHGGYSYPYLQRLLQPQQFLPSSLDNQLSRHSSQSAGIALQSLSDVVPQHAAVDAAPRSAVDPPPTNRGRRSPKDALVPLIVQAILSSPDCRLSLGDICRYVIDRSDTYRNTAAVSGAACRQNNVRHTLSHYEFFVKAGRLTAARGNYWTVHPVCRQRFADGDFRIKSSRRAVQMYEKNRINSGQEVREEIAATADDDVNK